jgi:AAA+ superfamily predicted ATPase
MTMSTDQTTPIRFSSSSREPKKNAENAAKEEIVTQISRLIGMNNIKEELNKLISFGELVKLRRDRDIPTDKIGLHMVFKGNPGTGKTVLAREFGKLFRAIGLLTNGQVVEVDRASLIGTHIGDAEKLIIDAFDRAKNGVLFIDEAYALGGISAEGITKDTSDPYSKAAVDTLIKLMEDRRGNVVVIAAGYPEPMERFLNLNQGLKSRFSKTLVFESYSHDELVKIFKLMAEEYSYLPEDDAVNVAQRFIKTWDIKAKDFGNAREVRTFLESIIPAQAERISFIPNFKELSNEELMTIVVEDVEAAINAHVTRV